MITLSSVSTVGSDTTLTFSYDDGAGGQSQSVNILLSDVLDRLQTVQKALGRPVTIDDAQLVIIQIINELRAGQQPLSQSFNFSTIIGVDLEAGQEASQAASQAASKQAIE